MRPHLATFRTGGLSIGARKPPLATWYAQLADASLPALSLPVTETFPPFGLVASALASPLARVRPRQPVDHRRRNGSQRRPEDRRGIAGDGGRGLVDLDSAEVAVSLLPATSTAVPLAERARPPTGERHRPGARGDARESVAARPRNRDVLLFHRAVLAAAVAEPEMVGTVLSMLKRKACCGTGGDRVARPVSECRAADSDARALAARRRSCRPALAARPR